MCSSDLAQIIKMGMNELYDGKAAYKPGTAGHQAYKNEIDRRRDAEERLRRRESSAPVAPVPPKSAMTRRDPVASVLRSQQELRDFNKRENARLAQMIKEGKVKGVTVDDLKRISNARLDRQISSTIQAMKGAKGTEALRLKNKLAELKAKRRESGKAQLGGA